MKLTRAFDSQIESERIPFLRPARAEARVAKVADRPDEGAGMLPRGEGDILGGRRTIAMVT